MVPANVAFNKALKTMIKDLISSYPECSQFKIFLMIYKIIKTLNKTFPVKYFKSIFVLKYRECIEKRDDSFLTFDLLNNSDLPLNVRILVKQLDGIYDVWVGMNEDNKTATWDHLNLLVKLSDSFDQV